MRHVGVLLRGVGCHKLPVGVWGEAPTANGLARYCHDKLSVCPSVTLVDWTVITRVGILQKKNNFPGA